VRPDWFTEQLRPSATRGSRAFLRTSSTTSATTIPVRRLVSFFLVAACDLLHARDGAAPLRGLAAQPPAPARALAPRHDAPLCGPPLDALAQLLPRRSRSACGVFAVPAQAGAARPSRSPPSPWSGSASPSSRRTRTSPRRRASPRPEKHFQETNAAKPRRRNRGSARTKLEDASTSSHLRNLRAGIRHRPPPTRRASGPATPARPPSAPGVTCIKAGESTYTELGVDAGLLAPCSSWRRSLVMLVRPRALQRLADRGDGRDARASGSRTDIIGVPWVVYVLWPLAGWRMSHPETTS